MANKNKKTSIGVFNILKSIVDYKKTNLKQIVSMGHRAEIEEPIIYSHINALNQYIRTNRYDAADVRETECEIADLEHQAIGIRTKINKGRFAAKELDQVKIFDQMYKTIAYAPTIKELQQEKIATEIKIAKIENSMDICELNMEPGIYSDDIINQAKQDMEHYQQEYTYQNKKLQNIISQLNQLQK